ncbi:hypothetical protein QFC21_007197 [Naganishia friedmannii]|uniref:Uncharacterized protein n=1 Tax=Naganishia friedmannii TaxID=89922 RepID=A0ACC2UXK1_9TREE|nr:hypothetical protein QFC21_007197 [Naganishia friedmannii]
MISLQLTRRTPLFNVGRVSLRESGRIGTMTKNSTNDVSTNVAPSCERSVVAATFSLPTTSNGRVISAPSSFAKGEDSEVFTRPEPDTNSENVPEARLRCSTNPNIKLSEGSNFAAEGSAWVFNNTRSIVMNIGIYAAVEKSGQQEVWIWIDDPSVYSTVPRADRRGFINKGTVSEELLSEHGLTECFASGESDWGQSVTKTDFLQVLYHQGFLVVMKDMINRHCKAI